MNLLKWHEARWLFTILPHPPYSPDLNAIELLFKILEDEIEPSDRATIA